MGSLKQDGLEEKLKDAFYSCGVSDDVWAEVAKVARVEMMKNVASGFESLLKMTTGDPEAEICRPGIQQVIDGLRRATEGE